ncbi:MAG: phosphoribosylanthranilate isomerase [Candidatus Omnitrophica bacterium]|nr:phosphoribosylanthranilate isomerase [Candidatus Omnitrophota bacterium]
MSGRPVQVKICGITTVRDAQVAVRAGANAIGLVFAAGSPRRVTPGQAARISQALVASAAIPVGVFVNDPPARIAALARRCRLGRLQLHGEEPPADCRALRRRTGLPVVKAVLVTDANDLNAIPRYRGTVDAILLDTAAPGHRSGFGERRPHHAPQRGGTGRAFDWRLAVRAKRFGLPIILAGGLRPGTVATAIRQVRPSEVDVSSGVERSPGRKDPAKVRAFLRAVQGV